MGHVLPCNLQSTALNTGQFSCHTTVLLLSFLDTPVVLYGVTTVLYNTASDMLLLTLLFLSLSHCR